MTVGGERHRLPDPFFVLATQNPIEQEGTYPLPEAQLDRFMLNIMVNYPSEQEELDIVRLTTSIHRPSVSKVLSSADILALQELIRKVPIADHVSHYAVRLARNTRRDKDSQNFIRDYVSWGAGPRQPVPGAGREGPGGAARPLSCLDRRHPRRRRPGIASQAHHQLQRRSRGPQAGRYRGTADQDRPRRRTRGRTKWKTTKNI